jgi:hypothetical protein
MRSAVDSIRVVLNKSGTTINKVSAGLPSDLWYFRSIPILSSPYIITNKDFAAWEQYTCAIKLVSLNFRFLTALSDVIYVQNK